MIKNVKLASKDDFTGDFSLLVGAKEGEKHKTGKNIACVGHGPKLAPTEAE